MLRLWPEQITVGLFSDRCWLRRGGKTSDLTGLAEMGIPALAGAFNALLAGAGPLRGARLDVIVSDRAARIAALPWQEKLRSKLEWHAYARAVFESSGLPADDRWICAPAVRYFGEQGLAAALPAALLAVFEEAANNHGARLRTVMPLSCAAYRSPRRWMAGSGSSWLLLEERDHATLLCFDGRRSIAHDTQPIFDENGLRQLLQRRLLAGAPARVAIWRAGKSPHGGTLETFTPDAAVSALPYDYWDRHA